LVRLEQPSLRGLPDRLVLLGLRLPPAQVAWLA